MADNEYHHYQIQNPKFIYNLVEKAYNVGIKEYFKHLKSVVETEKEKKFVECIENNISSINELVLKGVKTSLSKLNEAYNEVYNNIIKHYKHRVLKTNKGEEIAVVNRKDRYGDIINLTYSKEKELERYKKQISDALESISMDEKLQEKYKKIYSNCMKKHLNLDIDKDHNIKYMNYLGLPYMRDSAADAFSTQIGSIINSVELKNKYGLDEKEIQNLYTIVSEKCSKEELEKLVRDELEPDGLIKYLKKKGSPLFDKHYYSINKDAERAKKEAWYYVKYTVIASLKTLLIFLIPALFILYIIRKKFDIPMLKLLNPFKAIENVKTISNKSKSFPKTIAFILLYIAGLVLIYFVIAKSSIKIFKALIQYITLKKKLK